VKFFTAPDMLRALDDVALQAPFLGCMPTCLQSCVVNVSLIQVAQSAFNQSIEVFFSTFTYFPGGLFLYNKFHCI